MKKTPAERRQAERAGRFAALAWLVCTGHRLLARRYKAAGGEIDLVVRRGRMIIFCEVKYRRPADPDGMPSPRQQQRICNAAREFMARHHISPDLECRFDLIRISPFTWRQRLPIRHLRDAWWCNPV
ncbi:MAG: YraN family protein [Alphaproteobacteria bacterium]|nr:YraN family protein [Alphaproteobacteria bacterium]